MDDLKHLLCRKKSIIMILLLELAAVILYTGIAAAAFPAREWQFYENDMQVKRHGGVENGNYLDSSYEDAEAVVTPVFQLPKGVYYIEASYARHGIVVAGLIYDEARNGRELVDNYEFILNPEKETISYRVRIDEDSALRFKLRLTGDAVEGDYIQFLQMRITDSGLSYIYRVFWLVLLLVLFDLIVFGYFKYYAKWDAQRKMIFLVLTVTALFSSLPLFQNGLTAGADLTFHLSRLEGIYRGLGFDGGKFQFPVRIQPGWLDGYGYAVSVFYGDIFMYVPALLRAVGFTLEEAYKVYLGIVNIATVFTAFYSFKRMSKNEVSAMAGTVLYVGSTYRIERMYTGIVGGVSGMVFYPLIVAGFYLLFTEETESKEYRKIWIFLTAGFTGILMTHMLSCLMFGVYSVLLCLVMWKKVFRKNTFIALLKAAGATALLNLWFLVPLLHYMVSERLKINTQMGGKEQIGDYHAALADFTQEGKSWYELFTDFRVLGFAITLVLLAFVITWPMQERNVKSRRMRVFSLFTLFSLAVCMDFFPYVSLAKRSRLFTKLLSTLQYQERLVGIAVVMAACLAALFLAADLFDRKKMIWIAGALCCITLYQDLQFFAALSFDQIYQDLISLESRTDKELYSYTVGNGEYLPIETQTTELTYAIEGGEQLVIGRTQRAGLSFEAEVENTSSAESRILFPLLFYSGYQAKDLAGRGWLETTIGDNGRVAVTIPPGYNGTFRVSFHEPPLWRIAEVISLITLAAVVVAAYDLGCKKIFIKNE